MPWIDEMFANMETELAAESASRRNRTTRVALPDRPQKQTPGTLDAWNVLVTSITADVNEFNRHKERAGQTPVCVRQRHLQCEVYVPGMHSKMMLLTLDNDDLRVVVHPDFPAQPLTIRIESDQDSQHGFWVLGDLGKKPSKLSVAQLSEYLLKPILSSAAVD